MVGTISGMSRSATNNTPTGAKITGENNLRPQVVKPARIGFKV